MIESQGNPCCQQILMMMMILIINYQIRTQKSEVCLERNETDRVKNVYHQLYLYENISLWKPHTDEDIVPTARLSAISLQLLLPLVSSSQPVTSSQQNPHILSLPTSIK